MICAVVLFFGIGIGFAVHHKLTKPGVPFLVPLLEVRRTAPFQLEATTKPHTVIQCDFETGAVWGRGGGAALLEKEGTETISAKGRGWIGVLKRSIW